ncbi:MAG TPA: chromosome segregation protein SMC, partial [Candidatus Accumulibacter sp.]|nr:chromosome segregation protein SMC [Accumulibacter sp.]
RQTLEQRLKALAQIQTDRDALVGQIAQQQTLLLQRRQAVTERRAEFVENTLRDNAFVRIGVAPFGFDAREIGRQLRELLDVQDERFPEDILSAENGEPAGGLAFVLARAQGTPDAVTQVKGRLTGDASGFGGHFRNYLQRKRDKPEFADHVLAWFPEDDLRIEYRRDGTWHPIHQGSQGQRSAALLAFLLAFGDEPLVLDQPEDDLDNHLIYDLIVRQIRDNKLRRQLIVVTHNPNVVVNGDADLVHVMEFGAGQCFIQQSGALQEKAVREEVCRVMEGGREAFSRRWKRLGREN